MRININKLFITSFVVLSLCIPSAFAATLSEGNLENNTRRNIENNHDRTLEKNIKLGAEKNLDKFTLSITSPYDFNETVKRVQEAIISNDFRVFPDRYLEQGLTDDFSVNERQMIIRFCHFGKLYKMLQIEPRLGVVLPCKITVMEKENGQVQLTYINVEALAKVFDNQQLTLAAQEIAENYSDILDEVLL